MAWNLPKTNITVISEYENPFWNTYEQSVLDMDNWIDANREDKNKFIAGSITFNEVSGEATWADLTLVNPKGTGQITITGGTSAVADGQFGYVTVPRPYSTTTLSMIIATPPITAREAVPIFWRKGNSLYVNGGGGGGGTLSVDGQPQMDGDIVLTEGNNITLTQDTLNKEIEVAVTSAVETINATGYSDLTGDVEIAGIGAVSVNQSGQTITIDGDISLAKSGESALTGDITLSEGTNVSLTQSGQDIEIGLTSGLVSGINASGEPTLTGNVIVAGSNNASVGQSGQTITVDVDKIPSEDVEILSDGFSISKTIQEYINTVQGPTLVSGGLLTTGTAAGTSKIEAGTGIAKITNNELVETHFFEWSEFDNIATPDNDVTCFTVRFNGAAAPTVQSYSSASFFGAKNEVYVGCTLREGTSLDPLDIGPTGTDFNNKVINKGYIQGGGGIEYGSGAIISSDTSRYFYLTSGVWFTGTATKNSPAFDTSVADSFRSFYTTDSGTTWVSVTGNTQVPYTQYNDITTGLASVPPNRYVDHWFYLDYSCDHIYHLYGQSTYSTLAGAQAALQPSVVPYQISRYSVLIGRIITASSDSTVAVAESPFLIQFTGSSASDHNALSGLQGGTGGQYYHLTSSEYGNLNAYIPGAGTGSIVKSIGTNSATALNSKADGTRALANIESSAVRSGVAIDGATTGISQSIETLVLTGAVDTDDGYVVRPDDSVANITLVNDRYYRLQGTALCTTDYGSVEYELDGMFCCVSSSAYVKSFTYQKTGSSSGVTIEPEISAEANGQNIEFKIYGGSGTDWQFTLRGEVLRGDFDPVLKFVWLDKDSGFGNLRNQINEDGISVTRSVELNAITADGTAHTLTTRDGIDLDEGGSGTAGYLTGAPGTGDADDSVTKDGSINWAESTERNNNLPNGDLRISALIKTPSSFTASETLVQAYNSTDSVGWRIRTTTSSTLEMYIENGSSATIPLGTGTVEANTWYMVSANVDFGNVIGIGYRNGVKGTATTITSVVEFDGLDDKAVLEVLPGASGDGVFAWVKIESGTIDLTDQGSGVRYTDDVEEEEFLRYCGVWPQFAAVPRPTSWGRASGAYLKKWTGSVYELYRVGANWPRVEKIYDGSITKIGYLSEQEHTNVFLQSIDISNAAWTRSQITNISLSSDPAPDKSYRAYNIVSNASDAIHSITASYSGGLTVGEDYTVTIYAKPQDVDWIVINPQAGKNAYVDLVNKVEGTVTSGLTVNISEDHFSGFIRVDVSFEHVSGSACLIAPALANNDPTFAGDAVTPSTVLFSVCAIDSICCPSHIDTAGSTATRQGDILTFDAGENIGGQNTPYITLDHDIFSKDHTTEHRISSSIASSSYYCMTGFTNGFSGGTFRSHVYDGSSYSNSINDANFDADTWQLCSVDYADSYLLNTLDVDDGNIDTGPLMIENITDLEIGHNGDTKQFNGNIGPIRIYQKTDKPES